jgi:integrase
VYLDWWLSTLEARAQSGQRSTNTVDSARWAVEKWIKPALGTRRLRDLEPDDVEALLATMAAAGKSRSSLVRVRSYLGQALSVAERRGKVARNVARLAEMPATRPPAERRSLTPDQADKLLTAARGDRLEALWITQLMLGLRPGEVTGLRWDDLDRDTLWVSGSMKLARQAPGGKRTLALGDTKTARSRRPLRVPPPVLAALRAHKTRQKREQVRIGPEWSDRGLIFTTPLGTPLHPVNLRRHLDKLTDAAGIGHWSPVELRHSAASLMSAAGVPLEVIADVLGHTSTGMLEKHYRHRTRPIIDAHVAVMSDLFGGEKLPRPSPSAR